MVRQIILTGIIVLLPAGVQAQGRGMMPPAFHAPAVAPRVGMQAARAGISRAMPATMRPVLRGGGAARSRVGTPVVRGTRQQATTTRRHFDDENIGVRPGCNSAPGLGFDAVHQAAVCGSAGIDSRNRGFQSPLFFPFFDGGFFVPGSAAAVDEGPAAEAPQPEVIDSEARERARHNRVADPAPPTTAENASSAPPDNEEFVFVRRDGTVFFAVAYSWERGALRYVTNQGLRRTVTQDALDLDATRQFNEQRGLNFRLPA
jgi:hypothetical protein